MRTQNKTNGPGGKSRIALAFQERFADEASFINGIDLFVDGGSVELK